MLGRNNFRNLDIVSSASNLEYLFQDLPEYLPQKFRFEVISEKNIRVLGIKSYIDCNLFYIDIHSGCQAHKNFLICGTGKGNLERDYSYMILMYDGLEPYILAKNLSSFYYNEAMLEAGFIAVKKTHSKEWKILFIKGPLISKVYSISSFSNHVTDWGQNEIEFFPDKKVLNSITLDGKILEFIFTEKRIHSVSPIHCSLSPGYCEDAVFIVKKDNNKYNLIRLNNFQAVLPKDTGYISLLNKEVKPPVCNNTLFSDSTILYNRLVEDFDLLAIFIITEKGYFNFRKNKYLTPEEETNLKNTIQEYEKEWYTCDSYADMED